MISDSCVLVRRFHHCVVHTIRRFRPRSWPCELQVSAYYASVYALPLFHFGLGLELFLFDFDFDFHSLGAWEVRLCSLTLEPSSRPFIFALGPSVARLFSTEVPLSFRVLGSLQKNLFGFNALHPVFQLYFFSRNFEKSCSAGTDCAAS